MKLANAEQMRNIDAFAINALKIPSTLLMENAAEGIVSAAREVLGELTGRRIAVFCGSGNNGGDGACAARRLLALGCEVSVYLVGRREKLSSDMAEMERRLIEYGGEFLPFDCSCTLSGCDLIIDALFGVGLCRAVSGSFAEAIELINSCPAPVIAADIASGLSADTGEVLGCAVKANVTVTFSLSKPGHFLSDGMEYTGRLIIHDIGIPDAAVAAEKIELFSLTSSEIAPLFPLRRRDTHKGDYGRAVLLCGSEGLTGAAEMAALAALRSGAGLVSLGAPRCVYPILAGKLTEAMVFPLSDADGLVSPAAFDAFMAKPANARLIGPGLGRSKGVTELVCRLVVSANVPTVLDADGLNALSENIDILSGVSAPLILTPHDGEFARLGGDLSRGRLPAARSFACEHNVILILKGSGTIIALPDGRAWINRTGNPGMARGGSGDVLSGILLALLAQGFEPETAAVCSVWLHGRAGDVCAERYSQHGMLPTDMIGALPEIFREFEIKE